MRRALLVPRRCKACSSLENLLFGKKRLGTRARPLSLSSAPCNARARRHKSSDSTVVSAFALSSQSCSNLLKSLSEGDIHTYWLETSPKIPLVSEEWKKQERDIVSSFLSRRELESIERAKDEETRRERVLSRVLLRSVLSNYLKDIEAKDLVIDTEVSGKPYLAEQDQLASSKTTTIHFNVTHSPTLIGVCVANTAVGLDVEHLGRNTSHDVMKIAHRRFSCEEVLQLEGMSETHSRMERFLQLWTLKEAFLKATGLGISSPVGLKKCRFEVNVSDALLQFHLDSESKRGKEEDQERKLFPSLQQDQWNFSLFEPLPENAAAICWKEERVVEEDQTCERERDKKKKKKKKVVILSVVADSIEAFLENKVDLREIRPIASTHHHKGN